MTDITKNITKHYQSLIGSDLEKLHVPEWNMDVYYRRTYAFKDEAKVIELQTQGKVVEALVQSIITKARDKTGKPLFQDAHKITLMNEADPNVVTRVASTINNASMRLSQEEAVKESEPTQS